jgi:predicted nuclease of restriction endonuclease-like RecB superfamily
MDGKIRSYSPDFYLPDYDIYVEVKGYWWGDDRRKMDIVIKSYPEVKFLIVEKDQFEQIKNGNLSYLGVDGPVAPTGRAAA